MAGLWRYGSLASQSHASGPAMRKSISVLLATCLAGCVLANHGVDDMRNPGGNMPSTSSNMPSTSSDWIIGGATLPTQPPSFPSSSTSIFPMADGTRPENGEDWTSGQCEYAVTFSGKPSQVAASSEYVQMKYISPTAKGNARSEEANCRCRSNATPSNITRVQSTEGFGGLIKKMDHNILNSSFVETSPLGKFAEFESIAPSVGGDHISRARFYYGKKCFFILEVLAPRADDDPSRAFAFLNSTRLNSPRNLTVPNSLPSANPTPQTNDAASRLKALKQLLDQKLITPAEYDAKRQSIIDAM
jgi:hypothetical protein